MGQCSRLSMLCFSASFMHFDLFPRLDLPRVADKDFHSKCVSCARLSLILLKRVFTHKFTDRSDSLASGRSSSAPIASVDWD